jgi:hypothetical protein
LDDESKDIGVNKKGKITGVYIVKKKFARRHQAEEVRSVSNWRRVRAAASRKPQAAYGGGTSPRTAGTLRDFLWLSDLTESPSVAGERRLG